GSEGIVPDGYSLETAPYWLVRHQALSLRDYHAAPLARRLLYFTSISVATSRVRARNADGEHDAHAAIAIRTLLANGRPNSVLVRTAESLRKEQVAYIEAYRRWEAASTAAAPLSARRRQFDRQEDLLSSLVTRVLVGQASALRDSTMRVLSRRDSLRSSVAAAGSAASDADRFESEIEKIEARLETLGKRYSTEEIEPDGFTLEVAAGTRAAFEGGQWGNQRVDGAGAWITPMYRIGSKGVELIGVGRYLSNVNEFDGRDLIDLGARVGIDIGRGSLSAEHVWRRITGDAQLSVNAESVPGRKSSTRWSALFDYPIGGTLWAVASFGSDYRRPDGDRPVIATIGINLGFGAIEILPSR
ncbi:MAG TPA: hypothetical protein VFX40_02020, partial [Gemmatimonadaceae bacterium]|nr:hypothetical protein [Gemmatimonadaceae bacterium]